MSQEFQIVADGEKDRVYYPNQPRHPNVCNKLKEIFRAPYLGPPRDKLMYHLFALFSKMLT